MATTTTVTESKSENVNYGLTKNAFRWVAVGLAVSSSVVIISALSGVTLAELVSLGLIPFAVASLAAVAKLGPQILRFKLVVQGLTGISKRGLNGSSTVRVASEFVSLSTPSNIGGIVLRAAWLSTKSVQPGRSVWIGYTETLMDMYVASILAFTAAIFALMRGAPLIGSTILLVGGLVVVGNTVAVIIVIVRGSLTVPTGLFRLLSKFIGKDRAERVQSHVQEGTYTFAVAAKGLFHRDRLGLLAKGFILTAVDAILSGIALWVVLVAAGMHIDLFSATFVAFGVGTLASLPVSIGGSGISEFAMQSYLGAVYGFSAWAPVIVWRIATYHILLAFCGVVFVYLMMKMTGRSFRRPRFHGSSIERFLERPVANQS